MKISGTVEFYLDESIQPNEWKMKVNGRYMFLQQVLSFLKKGEEKKFQCVIEISRTKRLKTNKQLGYLYGALYPALMLLYKDLGYNLINIDSIDALMRLNYFYEEIVNTETGEVIKFPKRLQDASISEVRTFIELIIQYEFNEKFNVDAPDPEKYYSDTMKTN